MPRRPLSLRSIFRRDDQGMANPVQVSFLNHFIDDGLTARHLPPLLSMLAIQRDNHLPLLRSSAARYKRALEQSIIRFSTFIYHFFCVVCNRNNAGGRLVHLHDVDVRTEVDSDRAMPRTNPGRGRIRVRVWLCCTVLRQSPNWRGTPASP